MSDKELLELAAKAAGLRITWGEKYRVGDDEVDCTDMPFYVSDDREESPAYWNPLESDGDALRLAVKLYISPDFDERRGTVFTGYERADKWDTPIVEKLGDDHCTATRRAIVRAAAEIGKTHD